MNIARTSIPTAPKVPPHTSLGQRSRSARICDQALKGRLIPTTMNRPFRACWFGCRIPRALPWADIIRAVGPPELAHFDTLTAEAQRAIALLQERRTALISAAVTGQIDVRNSVAPASASPIGSCHE